MHQQVTYYDGKSARPRAVRLGTPPTAKDALRIYDSEDQSVYLDWPLAEIMPCASLHDPSIHLRRIKDTGERLVVADPAARQATLAWLGPQLKARRMRKIRNWGVGVGGAWLLIAVIWFNMNALLSVAVGAIPESWEADIGRESKGPLARLLAVKPTWPIPWCTEEGGVKALDILVARLGMTPVEFAENSETGKGAPGGKSGAPAAPDLAPLPEAVEVAVLKSSLPNAFSLPGRQIVVTSAMLAEVDSPEQLAAVLAHEMGHLTERHSLKRMIRAYGLGLFFKLVAGRGELFNSLGGFGDVLVENKFSREDEALADRLAVERLAAASLNPASLADLFVKFRTKEGKALGKLGTFPVWEYLSDHPDFDKRIAEIRALSKAYETRGGTPGSPALTPQEWTDLRNICGEKQKALNPI